METQAQTTQDKQVALFMVNGQEYLATIESKKFSDVLNAEVYDFKFVFRKMLVQMQQGPASMLMNEEAMTGLEVRIASINAMVILSNENEAHKLLRENYAQHVNQLNGGIIKPTKGLLKL